uniref:site-specific integrase n=1 Tax=uncultured Sphingomonas sp. TaxID=158754 RepID=UPI0025DF76C8
MTTPIADYYRHLTVDLRRSDHTVRAYVTTAERLCAFLSEHWGDAIDGAALARITAADLRAYL